MVRQNINSPVPFAFTVWAYDQAVQRARALGEKSVRSLQGLHHQYPSALPSDLVEALQDFHAHTPVPGLKGDGWDRRGSPRFSVTGSKLIIADTSAPERSWNVLELDRSWRGFAFLSGRPVEVGSVLTVSETGGQAEQPPVRAEVKSCRLRGDAWVVGCELLAIQEHERPA